MPWNLLDYDTSIAIYYNIYGYGDDDDDAG